jgi:hypothetical protein
LARRDIDVGRLCEAARKARLVLKRPREERRAMVRQYVGRHWSEEGALERVPVNLLSLYVQIIGRNLIAKNPRVMLSTFDKSLKPTLSAMQVWANQQVERMDLAGTLRRVVVDALFSIGVTKVALADPSQSAAVGWSVPAGAPMCEQVDLDDLVYDVHARDFRECSYVGHRYRVPLDVVKDAKLFGKARLKLEPATHGQFNAEGDERIGVLGATTYANSDRGFEDYVDLWEFYLPRLRQVVTVADDHLIGAQEGVNQEALAVKGWIGPECGPYHFLGFGVVPGNAMPKAPIQDLIDLHEAVNQGYRKVLRTLERIKELTFVSGSATNDAERVVKGNDGEVLRVDHPDLIKQVVTAGAALGPVVTLTTSLKDLFVYMGGNLDALGGLSPQAKTLGQDKLLSENSSRTVMDMQETTITHVSDVCKSLCWYWWHDPVQVQKSVHSLPGLPAIQTVRMVNPQDRQRGKFEDLDIRVDPYSLQFASPETRMAKLNQVVTQIVIPMMTLLVQQGIAFDINAYLKKIAQYMDLPDLADIVTIIEASPQQTTGASNPQTSVKPAQTERTYNRTNTPGQTREASDRNLMAAGLNIDTGGSSNGKPR